MANQKPSIRIDDCGDVEFTLANGERVWAWVSVEDPNEIFICSASFKGVTVRDAPGGEALVRPNV